MHANPKLRSGFISQPLLIGVSVFAAPAFAVKVSAQHTITFEVRGAGISASRELVRP